MTTETVNLLKRLIKAHSYYDAAAGDEKIRAEIYRKVQPVMRQLIAKGYDRTFCDCLLIFGAAFIWEELKKSSS